jgi:hypothetical protein
LYQGTTLVVPQTTIANMTGSRVCNPCPIPNFRSI